MKKILLIFLVLIISTSLIFADTSEMKKALQENINNEINIFVKDITFALYNYIIIEVQNDIVKLQTKKGENLYVKIDDIAGFLVVKESKK